MSKRIKKIRKNIIKKIRMQIKSNKLKKLIHKANFRLARIFISIFKCKEIIN